MVNGKSPEEIDLANRRFAIEQVFKHPPADGIDRVEVVKSLHEFLSEGPDIVAEQTGFSPT